MIVGKCDQGRVVLMFLAMLAFLAAFTLKIMAGIGARSGVFQQSTEDVTLKYATPISVAGWALFVWDFIYIWVLAMFTYFLVGLCRRNVYKWMYTTPAAFPYGFHVSLTINLCLNIVWLFLFDRELLLSALIISALMTVSDYMILFFSCQGLRVYGGWLNKYHTVDLWLIRILVQNGVAVFAAWETISTLLNLTIFLQHNTGVTRCDCSLLSLTLLLMELLAWFLLENFYLDEHMRYILTIYPVVILWFTGSVTNPSASTSQIYIFTVVILAVSCVLFVARISLVIWRHRKRPLHDNSVPSLSPVEIALTQRKLFM
ncbi:uncharacterized protein LOC130130161 [Lampris incognitus]|uniref:uncharacterized protein LOC130130161 n=1 Tax=Lampris incognitus TaxID=2546036 RepID=UPI0024B51DE2|nr:uncharacterized protein LOC130130161 [Lampris incognitus]